jgi:hypothetical protein
LENLFALRAGERGYQGGFIEHYLVPIIYPEGLTRTAQICLAIFVVIANVAAYSWAWREPLGFGRRADTGRGLRRHE